MIQAALLTNSCLEDLGFDRRKYPAEKNHLLDVFKETGINVEKNGIWQLVNPPENKYQFVKV